jgi:hypothetical protein
MRTLIVYLLFIFAISCHISRADDFDDYMTDLDDSISEEYTPKVPTLFKSFDNSDDQVILSTAPDQPKLIVTICYDEERGYYCKDLP